MFDKITATRETLRRLHTGDVSYIGLDALFGAFQEALEDLGKRIDLAVAPPNMGKPSVAKK